MTEPPAPERYWYCPYCGLTDVSRETRPHTKYHACPKRQGLAAPLFAAGTRDEAEAQAEAWRTQ